MDAIPIEINVKEIIGDAIIQMIIFEEDMREFAKNWGIES